MKVPDPGADGGAVWTAVFVMSAHEVPIGKELRKVVTLVTRDCFEVPGLRTGWPLILRFIH